MTQIEQLFIEAKEFLLKHSAIFTTHNLDDVEYVAHYMAKFAEQALASHAPSDPICTCGSSDGCLPECAALQAEPQISDAAAHPGCPICGKTVHGAIEHNDH